jgi:hypothetical protein
MPVATGMQGEMGEMRALMDRIHGTADPQERQRLMDEHMASMHRGMTAMGRMMDAGDASGMRSDCAQNEMQCRMRQMQRDQGRMSERMRMMQTMMDEMRAHMAEQGMGAGCASGPASASKPDNSESGSAQPDVPPGDHAAHH